MQDNVVTAIGTPNMALIKYWGKRDEKLILPMNSSISITFDETLATRTSVVFSGKFKQDRLYIDGKLVDLTKDDTAKERFSMVDKIRSRAGSKLKVLMVSRSNFPASSGLASSASGLATLAFAASKAIGLDLSAKELSIFARQGSGSACRGLYGGFVKWEKGVKSDGSDSYAKQLADEKHWPDLIDMVAIVSREKKKTSSRSGMRQTVASSILYKARMDYVENAVKRMEDAIAKKDFDALAEITMRDSNDMHSVMLDTFPPIMYLNDVSREIIAATHDMNEAEGRMVGAYTFDAGPNGNIITREKDVKRVTKMLKDIDGVEEILKVKVGKGPRFLGDKDALIDSSLEPILQ